jgi:hypothetical protein
MFGARGGSVKRRQRRRLENAMPDVIPNVLTIAGSDPSGGAGIQADLKTFSALGVYGASVIAALTAQNTQGGARVHRGRAGLCRCADHAVFDDVRIDAVKDRHGCHRGDCDRDCRPGAVLQTRENRA